MTALLDVELRRYLARRLAKIMVSIALAAIALTAVLVFVNSSKAEDPFLAVDLVSSSQEGEILVGTAFPWAMIAFLLGASFIGAEWRAGTVTTLLTWEPRRLRAFAAKAIVAGAAGAALVVVLQLLITAALWPSAVLRGSTAGVDGDFWATYAGVLLRSAGIGLLLSLVGFALTSLGRNTTAALGAVFVYFVVVENIIRGLRPGWSGWLVLDNFGVLAAGSGAANNSDFERSAMAAAALLTCYVGLLLVAAGWVFDRRDVA